jgi:hypothetical protein
LSAGEEVQAIDTHVAEGHALPQNYVLDNVAEVESGLPADAHMYTFADATKDAIQATAAYVVPEQVKETATAAAGHIAPEPEEASLASCTSSVSLPAARKQDAHDEFETSLIDVHVPVPTHGSPPRSYSQAPGLHRGAVFDEVEEDNQWETGLDYRRHAPGMGADTAAILASNADPWDRCLRMTGLEEEKVRQCERRLERAARSKRRFLGACENAGKGTSEAEDAVEMSARVLAALEEQERKCRSEVACVASSTSSSMRQAAEAKLRALEVKKQNAYMNFIEAQERLHCERHAFGHLRDRYRSESQAAVVAVEALSRQRVRANTAFRSLAHASAAISTPAPVPTVQPAPVEERKRSKATSQTSKQGAPPPRSNPSGGRSSLRCHSHTVAFSQKRSRVTGL